MGGRAEAWRSVRTLVLRKKKAREARKAGVRDHLAESCRLYTSDAADDWLVV